MSDIEVLMKQLKLSDDSINLTLGKIADICSHRELDPSSRALRHLKLGGNGNGNGNGNN